MIGSRRPWLCNLRKTYMELLRDMTLLRTVGHDTPPYTCGVRPGREMLNDQIRPVFTG